MCNVTLLLQLLCGTFLVINATNGFSFSLNNTRIRRQAQKESNCVNPFDFRCKSGECINEDKECDGTVDCRDGSDETNSCRRINCPKHLFQCAYGACIDSDLECDGKPDCKDKSDETSRNCTTQSEKCKASEFQCGSGECIDEDLKCDGTKHCRDHSDEISATCWKLQCPGYLYRCTYGACVDENAECNGIIECYDGSDEDPEVCKNKATPTPGPTPTPIPDPGSSPNSCVLPPHPGFGHWSIFHQSEVTNPGQHVSEGTILQVNCNNGYKLDGTTIVLCEKGQWSANIGSCLKTCPSIYSTDVMKVTCRFKNEETENCTEALDGTLAFYKCATFYEDLQLANKPVHVCRDGSWDQRRPSCAPVCGQKTVTATVLIVNGTNVTRGDYPWQVALYKAKNKLLICGGSLINQRVILTAAHCVTNAKGIAHPKENYIVAVGKYYAKFDDPRDVNEAQFSPLHSMFVHSDYRGETQNYVSDIAILVTEKTFTLSLRVQPVCVDWGSNFIQHINEKTVGYVTGWGYTQENSSPSDVLKELKIPPYVSFQKCQESLPEDYDRYLTSDKLCAGYLDRGTSVCKGDSGGGLVYKVKNRYYITGIVSLAPTADSGGCNSQEYGLYTSVQKYVDNFILNKEAQFRPDIR